jgi:hypothetical protein
MGLKPEYTGSHKVTLPADFMETVEAVVELFEDEIAEVAVDPNLSGMQTLNQHRFLAGIVGLVVCLLPPDWITAFF